MRQFEPAGGVVRRIAVPVERGKPVREIPLLRSPERPKGGRLHPHQYGIDSHVTNLCKDEIYLLGPNTVGLFALAGC